MYKRQFYQIVESNRIEKSIRQRESNRIESNHFSANRNALIEINNKVRVRVRVQVRDRWRCRHSGSMRSQDACEYNIILPPFCSVSCHEVNNLFWWRKKAMSTRKRITELSVAELRTQLGKRGVEVAGDRPTLIAKLKKVCCHEIMYPPFGCVD